MPQRVHVSTAPLRNERARWQPGNSMGSKIAAYPLRRFNRTFRILSPRACEPMIGRIGGMSDSGRCVRPWILWRAWHTAHRRRSLWIARASISRHARGMRSGHGVRGGPACTSLPCSCPGQPGLRPARPGM